MSEQRTLMVYPYLVDRLGWVFDGVRTGRRLVESPRRDRP